MDNDKRPRDLTAWGIVGILLLPILCCAGPALIGVLGTLGLGAVFASIAHDWLVGAIFLVIAVGIASVLIVRRRRADCTSSTACSSTQSQAPGMQTK